MNDTGQVYEGMRILRNNIHHTKGSYGNLVRDNVIHDTGCSCILTYSTVGNGQPNRIEGNAMWNCGDHAIQSAADATIANNIILGAVGDGITMQPHQAGAPKNGWSFTTQ